MRIPDVRGHTWSYYHVLAAYFKFLHWPRLLLSHAIYDKFIALHHETWSNVILRHKRPIFSLVRKAAWKRFTSAFFRSGPLSNSPQSVQPTTYHTHRLWSRPPGPVTPLVPAPLNQPHRLEVEYQLCSPPMSSDAGALRRASARIR